MRELLDRSRNQWGFIRRSDERNVRLAIFVHGFRGSYFGTWGNLPTCLREQSDRDARLTTWDYLFLGYDCATIGNLVRIAELIASQCKMAANGDAPFDTPYEQFALFGHSLGTLGIRQLLCATSLLPDGLHDKLRGVALFGSPLNGSSLAPGGKLLGLLDILKGPVAAINAISPSGFQIKDSLRTDGAQMQMLRVWNNSMRRQINLPVARTYQGLGDWVVGPGLVGDNWEGDDKILCNLDHKALSKIDDPTEWRNSFLRDAILKALA